MKKMILVLSMMLISANAYAFGLSMGLSAPGFGLSFLRGDHAERMVKNLEDSGMKEKSAFSFAPAVQLDLMIELLPFFAIETGIGWTISSIIYEYETASVKEELTIERNELTIPIMLRLQHQIGSLLGYAAVGVKIGMPQSEIYMYKKVFEDDRLSRSENYEYSSEITLDVAFAVGFELNILDSHYFGVRGGYDLNVINPIDIEYVVSDYEWYQDNFNVSLTYRYAFGR